MHSSEQETSKAESFSLFDDLFGGGGGGVVAGSYKEPSSLASAMESTPARPLVAAQPGKVSKMENTPPHSTQLEAHLPPSSAVRKAAGPAANARPFGGALSPNPSPGPKLSLRERAARLGLAKKNA